MGYDLTSAIVRSKAHPQPFWCLMRPGDDDPLEIDGNVGKSPVDDLSVNVCRFVMFFQSRNGISDIERKRKPVGTGGKASKLKAALFIISDCIRIPHSCLLECLFVDVPSLRGFFFCGTANVWLEETFCLRAFPCQSVDLDHRHFNAYRVFVVIFAAWCLSCPEQESEMSTLLQPPQNTQKLTAPSSMEEMKRYFHCRTHQSSSWWDPQSLVAWHWRVNNRHGSQKHPVHERHWKFDGVDEYCFKTTQCLGCCRRSLGIGSCGYWQNRRVGISGGAFFLPSWKTLPTKPLAHAAIRRNNVLFGIAGSHQPAGKALANQILIHDYEWPSYHVVEEFADLVENPGDLLSIYIYIYLFANQYEPLVRDVFGGNTCLLCCFLTLLDVVFLYF